VSSRRRRKEGGVGGSVGGSIIDRDAIMAVIARCNADVMMVVVVVVVQVSGP